MPAVFEEIKNSANLPEVSWCPARVFPRTKAQDDAVRLPLQQGIRECSVKKDLAGGISRRLKAMRHQRLDAASVSVHGANGSRARSRVACIDDSSINHKDRRCSSAK